MKKLIIGLFLVSATIFFIACEGDNLVPDEDLIQQIMDSQEKTSISQTDLTEDMHSYMENEYAAVLVEEAYHVRGKGYELELETGINVYFNERNRCLGDRPHPNPRFRCLRGDSIGVADLPQAILDFVADSLPNQTIEVAVLKQFGIYAIGLSSHAILIFDENGEFISRCGRWNGPGHPGRRCMRGDEVAVADLSQSIVDYVADNYAGETIEKASTKPNGVIAIKLSDNTILLFNAEGEFIRECRG